MKCLWLLLFLTGCMVGPDHETPQVTMPSRYVEETEKTSPIDLAHWWEQFEDPLLHELIEEALVGNYDLKIAVEKIREVRAFYRIEASHLWPEIDGVGFAERMRNSQNFRGINIASPALESTTGLETDTGSFGPIYQNLFQIGFDATWELDFFGKIRRAKEAAAYDWKASIENARDVQVTLLGEVGRVYLDICGLQEQIRLTEKYIHLEEELVELAASRYDAGLTSEREWDRARAQLDTTVATLPPLIASRKAAIYQLAVLLGTLPEQLEERFSYEQSIPQASGKIPPNLPSDLLRRRPDIRKAEDDLDAARARIGVAKADLFPSFSLTGAFGYASSDQTNWLTPPSRIWNIGPAFTWPLFTAGRIQAQIRARTSIQKQALFSYEQTVLRSLQDVESSLVAYYQESRREETLSAETGARVRDQELTGDLYASGLVNLSDYLDVEAVALQAEDQWIQSRRAQMADLVSIYKSLGGGW